MPVTFCSARHKFTVGSALNAIRDLDDYVEAAALRDDLADDVRLSGFELGMINERLRIYGRLVALLEGALDDGELDGLGSTDLHLILRGERLENFVARLSQIARSVRCLEESADLYDGNEVSKSFRKSIKRENREGARW